MATHLLYLLEPLHVDEETRLSVVHCSCEHESVEVMPCSVQLIDLFHDLRHGVCLGVKASEKPF